MGIKFCSHIMLENTSLLLWKARFMQNKAICAFNEPLREFYKAHVEDFWALVLFMVWICANRIWLSDFQAMNSSLVIVYVHK